MSKRAMYKGTREVRTFADLMHAALVMLQKTEEDPRGSTYTTMSALLFMAFSFEAYLNHLGQLRLSFWHLVEPIRVMDKYELLCNHLGVRPDFSKRPYQSLRRLFQFRNSLAHGRTTILKVEKQVSINDDPWKHTPKTAWEEYCTLSNAKRAKKDVVAAISELHLAADLGEFAFMHGMTSSEITASPAAKGDP